MSSLFPFRRTRAGRPPLGRDFTLLWWASALTNLGDGALLAAGPLLVASVAPSPLAVAGAAAVQTAPHLLFSPFAGALVDRLPRRSVLVAADPARGAVLALLALAVLTGGAHLWAVYAAVFALGVGETLADTAYGALVPSVVPKELLGRANARLALTFSLNNQLLGPPLGAALFAVLWALPFGFDALAYAVAGLVVLRLSVRPRAPEPERRNGGGLWADTLQGLVFVGGVPVLRTLTGCILVMNLTGVGAFSIWVLYAREHLGLSEAGFGLFIAAGAVGGVVGSRVYGFWEPRVGRAFLLRWGLVLEAATYAALALVASPWAAGAVMALFGVHAVVWGTAAVTVRQSVTPDGLLGRAAGVYRWADLGGAALGAVLGGVLAQALGLLAPFWVAAAAVGVLAAVAWRPLGAADAEPATGNSGRRS
ncbi:MFS transporter [Nocardiopsis sp. NPDC006139]|uniref:MFS transporter n=1 Tax=Nocardiopsis sp. NPDC006139 TaxID=3154578 RepID=UPI0033B87F4A